MLISVESLNKLKFECLHKVKVVNPYTGESSLVPCGTCDACLLRKSFSNEMLTSLMSSSIKYTYFITLTYATNNVPRYRIVNKTPLADNPEYVQVDCMVSPRYFLTGNLQRGIDRTFSRNSMGLSPSASATFSFICKRTYLENYEAKASLYLNNKKKFMQDAYGFISKQDLALFYKRLRKNIYIKTGLYGKIHTYSVGEYTPKHFRPHFHILLSTDSESVASCLRDAVIASWKYGRTDYSRVRKTACSYVAGYLNSSLLTPWHLRKISLCRPFSRYSNGYREILFKNEIERAIQGDVSGLLDKKKFTYNGKLWKINPPLSILNSVFFPIRTDSHATVSALHGTVYSFSKFVSGFNNKQSVSQNLSRIFGILSTARYRDTRFFCEEEYTFITRFLRLEASSFNISEQEFVQKMYRGIRFFEKILSYYGLSLYRRKELITRERDLYFIIYNSIKFYNAYERQNKKNYYSRLVDFEPYLAKNLWKQTTESLTELRESPVGVQILEFQHML
ncbi:MAG: hypothetical protein O2U61_02905, partial [Candidatus Bathyarchaeota archaeon]|nr:hypothetical protein [Candidatus Bathyarchaeota archaeon]